MSSLMSEPEITVFFLKNDFRKFLVQMFTIKKTIKFNTAWFFIENADH